MKVQKNLTSPSWKKKLQTEFESDYFLNLNNFLEQQKNKIIFPEQKNVFSALELTDFSNVKVIILGQDPYHGEGQAHGLSFSVLAGIKNPPSLQNIFKELKSDLQLAEPPNGYLEKWAVQGVLLLNSVLTVEAGKPNSHQGQGWEIFTDRIIKILSQEKEHLVFILWGAYAQKKSDLIDSSKHFIITSPHPSPLSSYRGFFGSKPFSKTNAYLTSFGKSPINWEL